MNNEATLDKTGDSKLTAAAEETPVAATVSEEGNEQACDCTNGVCVLNWKPSRTAA